MTAHEERLVLELHAKWGNRWSRIARKLPGRTDNEIKNYWRTHMRKKAQEQKQTITPSTALSDSSSSSNPTQESLSPDREKESFYDAVGFDAEFSLNGNKQAEEIVDRVYSMDDIWEDIDKAKESHISQLYNSFNEGSSLYCPMTVSPVRDYCSGSLWKMDDGESKMFLPSTNQFPSYYDLSEAPSYG